MTWHWYLSVKITTTLPYCVTSIVYEQYHLTIELFTCKRRRYMCEFVKHVLEQIKYATYCDMKLFSHNTIINFKAHLWFTLLFNWQGKSVNNDYVQEKTIGTRKDIQ